MTSSGEVKGRSKWPEIYDLNKAVIGNNPALILPGQQLTIPAA